VYGPKKKEKRDMVKLNTGNVKKEIEKKGVSRLTKRKKGFNLVARGTDFVKTSATGKGGRENGEGKWETSFSGVCSALKMGTRGIGTMDPLKKGKKKETARAETKEKN